MLRSITNFIQKALSFKKKKLPLVGEIHTKK